MKRWVILDPQWIVEMAGKINRELPLHKLDSDRMLDSNPKYRRDFQRFENSGLITRSLLQHQSFWGDYTEVFDFLVAFMDHYGLLCAADTDDLFYVPGRLCTISDDEFAHFPSFCLVADFSGSFLPNEFFGRLISLAAVDKKKAGNIYRSDAAKISTSSMNPEEKDSGNFVYIWNRGCLDATIRIGFTDICPQMIATVRECIVRCCRKYYNERLKEPMLKICIYDNDQPLFFSLDDVESRLNRAQDATNERIEALNVREKSIPLIHLAPYVIAKKRTKNVDTNEHVDFF